MLEDNGSVRYLPTEALALCEVFVKVHVSDGSECNATMIRGLLLSLPQLPCPRRERCPASYNKAIEHKELYLMKFSAATEVDGPMSVEVGGGVQLCGPRSGPCGGVKSGPH